MAGTEKCLERHEWVKHGVCTKMQAPQYFEWSLNKAKAMSVALASLAGQRITRYRFNQVIAEKLPEVNGGVLASACREARTGRDTFTNREAFAAACVGGGVLASACREARTGRDTFTNRDALAVAFVGGGVLASACRGTFAAVFCNVLFLQGGQNVHICRRFSPPPLIHTPEIRW